jgi:hypothetical protein
MEELPGAIYLFNLSLLAVTFAVVSALVMLVRQTMGGRLTNFDVYLITSYVSFGFVIAFNAILPPLIFLFEPPPVVLWALGSGLAAILHGSVLANRIKLRRRVSKEPMSWAVAGSFTTHGLVVLVLAVNAVVPSIQGVGPFAAALTVALAIMLWTFVRRISSLLGDKAGEDWDPKRG